MKRPTDQFRVRNVLIITVMTVAAVACAPSVKVRSDTDPGVNMRQYQT